ncbi:MOSC domain-containing protein [Amycolatopsis rubida]|uniref:MOSC domain-containing protein n=1 Tax=Amycolatopsis rubida TaxID=112413 RepID=A0ABX0BUT4_9PSEU|nr:MOSC domain-containing protein [Amycolatopsis sp. M39]MYW92511.1 MOSC domain-containing protein [Amycolatopsis rubida]NEC57498.1 MOSC domain-containing protein [Amycolatopsis rubida]OAP27001.1 MOSC domain protein [Amycolatopsis sp. M39]
MNAPAVAELWRYPVKSMGGEQVPELVLGHGVAGDRAFAVVAVATGRVLTAKRVPQLLDATARWLGGEAEIALPGGPAVRTDDPDAEAVLSRWLGQPVRLERPVGRAVAVEEYQGDPDGSAELATFDLPAWGFVDDSPVHLLSRDSLRAAKSWHPGGDWDLRRFRPNIVLAPGPAADPAADPAAVPAARSGEGAVGDELRIGHAVLEVTGLCQRCVMVSQPQRGLPKDREVLRSIIRETGAMFGTYAAVLRPGQVRCGDPVTVPVAVQADGAG